MLSTVLNALPIAGLVILAAGGGTTVDLPTYAQWGILGVTVLALATGRFLVPAYLYQSEKARADAAEERERALLMGMSQAAISAIQENTATLNQLSQRISDVANARREGG